MILLDAVSADQLWRKAVELVREKGAVQPSREGETLEILHVCSTLKDPRQRVVFARPINPAFAIAELVWILSGRRNLGFLTSWNTRMAKYSDDGSTLDGAYGYRLRRFQGLDQIELAYRALKKTPHSRQVVLQIWDCTRDMPNPIPRSKDIPCNLASHLMLRTGSLEWLQMMRSNDLWLGLPYNLIQFTTLQEIMSGWLGVEPGSYNHVSDSLHVYKRDWADLEKVQVRAVRPPTNSSDLRLSHARWKGLLPRLVKMCVDLARCRNVADVKSVLRRLGDLPAPYFEWAWVLGAEALRRHGHDEEAFSIIEGAGRYWGQSWRIWATRKAKNEGD